MATDNAIAAHPQSDPNKDSPKETDQLTADLDSSLDTPRRETEPDSSAQPSQPNESAGSHAQGASTNTDTNSQPEQPNQSGKDGAAPTALEEEEDASNSAGRPQSCLKAVDNPRTVERQRRLKEGQSLLVSFDERVVVHTVPYWDPCGETFYDTDPLDKQRGPNCCTLL